MAIPPIEVKVDMRGVLMKDPPKAIKIYEREMGAAMRTSVSKLEADVKRGTPVGATTFLRGSIFSAVRGTGLNLHGVVASNSVYAEPVELGSAPHWPPPGPIELWVQRVLGVSDAKEIRRTAYVISRKISKTGTAARHMFRNAFQANKEKITRLLEAARDRVISQLKRG